MPPDGKQSVNEKAEAFYRMGRIAIERLERRRKYEWRINFGLWTAFAIGTGYLFTNEVNIDVWRFICVCIFILDSERVGIVEPLSELT